MIRFIFPGICLIVLHIAALGTVSKFVSASHVVDLDLKSSSTAESSIAFCLCATILSCALVCHSIALYRCEGRITSTTTGVLASLLLIPVLGGTICLGVSGGTLLNHDETNNGSFRLLYLVTLFETWSALWGTAVLCMVWLFIVLALSRGRDFIEERDAGRILVRRRATTSNGDGSPGNGFWSGVSLFGQKKKISAEPEGQRELVEMIDMERQVQDNHGDSTTLVEESGLNTPETEGTMGLLDGPDMPEIEEIDVTFGDQALEMAEQALDHDESRLMEDHLGNNSLEEAESLANITEEHIDDPPKNETLQVDEPLSGILPPSREPLTSLGGVLANIVEGDEGDEEREEEGVEEEPTDAQSDKSSNYDAPQPSSSSSEGDAFDEIASTSGPLQALYMEYGNDLLDVLMPEDSSDSSSSFSDDTISNVEAEQPSINLPMPPRIRTPGISSSSPAIAPVAPPLHSREMQGLNVVFIGPCTPTSPLRQVTNARSSSDDSRSVASIPLPLPSPEPARCNDGPILPSGTPSRDVSRAPELMNFRDISPLSELAIWTSVWARDLREARGQSQSQHSRNVQADLELEADRILELHFHGRWPRRY